MIIIVLKITQREVLYFFSEECVSLKIILHTRVGCLFDWVSYYDV